MKIVKMRIKRADIRRAACPPRVDHSALGGTTTGGSRQVGRLLITEDLPHEFRGGRSRGLKSCAAAVNPASKLVWRGVEEFAARRPQKPAGVRSSATSPILYRSFNSGRSPTGVQAIGQPLCMASENTTGMLSMRDGSTK